MDNKKFLLDKSSAARRQFVEAVKLFFEQRDIVAIHTLAAAAREIVEDLAEASNVTKSIKQTIEGYLEKKPELQKKLHSVWVEQQNFMKHADRDPNSSITFESSRTCVLLYDALQTYTQLKGETFPEAVLFMSWWWIKTGLINEVDTPEAKNAREVTKDLKSDDMKSWYQLGQVMGIYR